MIESTNGEPINNLHFGDSVQTALDEVYILMKLKYPKITHKQVEEIIGLWERYLITIDTQFEDGFDNLFGLGNGKEENL